jgi:hypothetical protein
MKVSVLVHGEQVAKTSFGRFEHRVLDGMEFVVDELTLWLLVVQDREHIYRLLLPTSQDEPTR